MKQVIIFTVAACAVFGLNAAAWCATPVAPVGAEYEITARYETAGTSTDGSSSSSRGSDSIRERVIGVSSDGVELEYDLTADASPEARASVWQFPARVLRPANGPLQLLNKAELESRLDAWLKSGNVTRESCGRWIFTWNAFQIECDPQSVLATIEDFDLTTIKASESGVFRDPDARAAAQLDRVSGSRGVAYLAKMEISPDAVRQAEAESDVVAGELTGQPITLDAALRKRADEDITGTIEIRLDLNESGEVWRRTRTVKLKTKTPERTSTESKTYVTERRRIGARQGRR